LKRSLFNDGFVHVKSLLNCEELNLLIEAINSNIDSPGPFAKTLKPKNDSLGKFFMDFNNWRRLPKIEQVCKLNKIVNLVTSLTDSNKCWLFHDHILIKSGNALPTPLHHDRPYYITKGKLNCSVWITADKVSRDSGLIFYKKTHKLNKLFIPKAFIDGGNIDSKNDLDFEDIDQFPISNHEAVDFAMMPGDAIIFFNSSIHTSHPHNSERIRRALSIRYLLDGASLTKKYINATPPFDRMGVKIDEGSTIPENYFPLLKS
tara:strand:- start:187 stop:969 length:783 start_codon:yes stop_codon:yes gene_type:complete